MIRQIKRLRRKIAVISLIILVIGSPIIYYLMVNAGRANASWWNGDWAYRKAINITAHTADENNVYLNLTGSEPAGTHTTKFMEAGSAATQGLEFYSGSQTTGAGAAVTSDSQAVAGSVRSIKTITAASGSSWAFFEKDGVLPAAGSRLSTYIRFTALPTNATRFISFSNSGGGQNNKNFGISLNTSGKLEIRDNGNGVQATGTTTLSSNTDYRVSIAVSKTSQLVNTVTVYLNSDPEVTATNIDMSGADMADLVMGQMDNGTTINTTIYFAHIFVDDGTSGDTGDIRVTAKRPLSNGSANNWSTNGSAGGYGTGNARYENEQPLNTSNFMSTTGTSSQVEEYSIEGASVGDVDISGKTIVDYTGWVYANASTSLTANIVLANLQSNVSLTTTNTMFTKAAGSGTYPAGNTDIGMNAGTTAGTKSMYEAGIMVAYVPTNNPIDTSDSTKFQSDCGDLRFTDQSGNLLPYYILSSCGTAGTNIHVLMKNFPAGPQTIYYYYGNPSAPNGFSNSDFGTEATGVTIGSFGSEEQVPTAPIAYWKFDEGTGTTTSDSSSNKATGTLAGPSWQTEDLCISAKCLYFPGGSSVTVSKTVSGVESVSFWIRPASSSAALVDLNAADASITASSGTITASNFTSPTYYVNGNQTTSPTLVANQWNFVTVTTGTGINASAIKIGNVKGDYLIGTLDEIKLYGYALSADQVKANYNSRGSASAGAVLGASDANMPSALSNGLTGYWKMNGTSTGNSLPDSSGNNETLGDNGSIAYSAGKFGTAPTFNGSSKYFNVNPNIYTFINYKSIFGNATVDKPTGTAANDLLILLCGQASTTSFSPPSGFNFINTVQNGDGSIQEDMYYKIATPSEPSTYTCGNAYQVQMLTYRNISGLTPDLSDVGNATSGTTMTAPTVSTSVANDLVVRMFATWVSNTISSAPATQRMNVFDGGGDAVYVSDSFKAAAGATGTATATQDTSGQWVAMTAAFKPASAISTTISGVRTVAFWVKPGATTDNFINLASGIYINASSGTISATGWTNPTIYVNGTQSSTIASGVWQHVVVTSTSPITADAFEVGRANGSYAANNTQMAEVRTYNRALSTADITALYNWAPGPNAYYKFEEGTGTTTADSSGNGYNGTFVNDGPFWVPGKIGKGLSFNRDATFRAVYAVDPMPTADFTYSFWTQMKSNSNTRYLLDANGGTSGVTDEEFYVRSYPNFTQTLTVGLNAADVVTSNTSLTLDKWYYVTVTRSGSTVSLYLNGVLDNTGTDGTALTFDPTCYLLMGVHQYDQGCASTTFADEWSGYLDDLKIYSYARTPGQITQDMNGGHPAPGSPVGSAVGYWKFDEGYGTTANNSGNGGAVLNGTLNGAKWNQDGKFGKALNFDGSNNYVDLGTSFKTPSNITVSAWVNLASNAIGDYVRPIFVKGAWGGDAEGDFRLQIATSGCDSSSSGTGSFSFDLNTSTTDYCAQDSAGATIGSWVFLTGTYDGTNIKLYENGVLISTTSTGGTFNDNSHSSYIGAYPSNIASTTLSGKIDEVKVYNSALTADQVKAEYNHGKALVLGALSDTSQLSGGSVASNSAGAEYCVPGSSESCAGPVGRWDFEEGVGSTVNDTSSNSNTGTWVGTLSGQWTTGKVGKAGNFNGNAVEVADTAILDGSTAFTVEGWVNPTDGAGRTLFAKSAFILGGWSVYYESFTNGINFALGAKTITGGFVNGWAHVAAVYDPGNSMAIYVNGRLVTYDTSSIPASFTNSQTFKIGAVGDGGGGYAANMLGQIDQVRLFKYARTPAQVAWDYNQGKPVAYYKMDECQGTALHDSSGNNNHGTKSGSSTTGTCNTASSFWGGSAGNSTTNSGKYNFSPTFTTASSDVVTIPDSNSLDISPGGTMMAWVKLATLNQWNGILTKATGPGCENGDMNYQIEISASNQLFVCAGSSDTGYSSNSTLTTGVWYHVAATWDGTTVKLYINGQLDKSTAQLSVPPTNAGSLYIGNSFNGDYFAGQIDEVKIFNYPLTTSQIKLQYNQGSAVRFGPSTGAP